MNPIETIATRSDVRHITSSGKCMLAVGDSFETPIEEQPYARIIVTSPPYNLGMEYESFSSWGEYIDFIGRFASLCDNIVLPGGYAFVNFQVEYTSPVRLEQVYMDKFGDVGRRVITERVWKKKESTIARKAYNYRSPRAIAGHEHLWTFRRKSDTAWDPPRNRERSLMSVWDTSDEPTGVLKQHPAAFPEAIPRWAIEVHCDEGDMVVDPFSGTGTTACVAKRMGMRSVGVEKRRDYHDIAVGRMLMLDL